MVKLNSRSWQLKDWETQIDRILSIISIARVTIFFTLLMFTALANQIGHIWQVDLPPAFTALFSKKIYFWLVGYCLLTLLGIFHPSWQKQKSDELPKLNAFADITMFTLLMHFLGGIDSGFGMLILPFLALACLLSYGRYPALYAGYTTLLILILLLVREWPIQTHNHHHYFNSLTGHVILIASCWLVTFIIAYSASFLLRAGESVRRHRVAFGRINALSKVVLNRMQEAVIVIDADQRVWMHNRQTLRYFSNIKSGKKVPFLNDLVLRWQSNTKTSYETNLILQGTDMNIRAVPVLQENTELLLLFIRAEKERIAEAQSVKLASLGLLTANFAHEIRNPLSAMRQAIGLLIENTENDPVYTKLCQIVDKNITRIDKMIEEVSTLNKSDKVNKESITLIDFWRSFAQEFILTRPQAAQCLKVSIVKNTEVLFDPMHLQQIMWNLCNNAWRHSSQNAKGAITLTAFPINNNQISLRVFDDGAGVPPEVINHLFEPFYTTQAEGTGLGLYVARELAHANKGDLRYLSDKKAFELILPKAKYD